MSNGTPNSLLAFNSDEQQEFQLEKFTFGLVDYVVFAVMLLTSAGIGAYFGFFAKAKNTTDEYLMGGKKMQTIPIAISLVASQLSGIAVMTVPSEIYSFGACYFFVVFPIIIVMPIISYIVVPVFYENKIVNCYEYLQIRFNKQIRRLVTLFFLVQCFLIMPIFTFVPSLAFSQVTGINLHLINAAVSSICVFYTMLGGIKAVVWTDVVQAAIMLISVFMVGVLGVIRVGGFANIVEKAYDGGRLDLSFSWDPRVRLSVWGALINATIMWVGHIGLNQSCVQRIVSLPSMKHAQKALSWAGLGFILIMGGNCFIGIIMFAHYYGCDPVAAGLVEKADKLMPYFVQDIIGHIKGTPGIFISCVFSASLSTLSAVMNSLAGVVYFDYIKPCIKHTDAKANAVMKTMVVGMGFYVLLGGFAVQQFSSILQLTITISGINTGATLGIFLLGMLVPRVNGRVAAISLVTALLAMIWIITNAQLRIKSGAIRYAPIATSIEDCPAQNLQAIAESIYHNLTTTTPLPMTTDPPQVTTAFGSNRSFSLYEVSFYWYKFFGAFFVWVVAIPLSFIWKPHDDEKVNPKLFSPFVRRFIKPHTVEMDEILTDKPTNEARSTNDSNTTISIPELQNGTKKLLN